MNSLYNLAGRQSAAIRADIDAYSRDPLAHASLRSQIMTSLSAFVKTIEDYEAIAKRELVISKREKALNRAANFHAEVRQFREELAHVQARPPTNASSALSFHAGANPNTTATRARVVDMQPSIGQGGVYSTELTQSSSTYAPYQPMGYSTPSTSTHHMSGIPTVSVTTGQPSYSTPAMPTLQQDPLAAYRIHSATYAPPDERTYSMRESHALREHSFIQNTESQLDAFITQGRSVLGNLTEQRGILKQTRKRLLDAANTVGLSRELIGVIDRMSTQDTILFFGGAVLTLTAFYFIYRWLG